ncbi:MAG: bifunctional nuclease family protein [Candidatus Aenigmatarchaeota archaeon]
MLKKSKMIKLFVVSFLIAVILLYFQYQYILKQVTSTDGFVKLEVKEILVQNEFAIVKLSNKCNEFEFYTTQQQAESIQIGEKNITYFRPTTHDIIKSILENYEIKPINVKIIKMEEGTYFAEMTFQKGLKFLTVDIRPSDAIAIAVRMKVPIFVNENLTRKVC